jgi:sulfur relay (sulfurtransferase) DsrC/TusE family protein
VIQRDLWLSFNDNAGSNRFREFVMVDSEKNNFQKMRVGPCIKVLGEAMIDMIDQALIRLRLYHEFKNNPDNNDKINPHEFYKDTKQYLGWRSLWFTRLFKILNSKKERIKTEEYNHNLVFLKEFYYWFKIEGVD